MTAFITAASLGVLLSVLGVINMSGNISSLHWYHRQRVAEEDTKRFGSLVGCGTLICGLACIFYGVMFLIFEITAIAPFVIVGAIVLTAGLVVGIGINLYAIKKYNKGIF